MRILGIETSCDETAAAVLSGGPTVLSNVVSSQVSFHSPYGGVVPELASRQHVRNITFVVQSALDKANLSLSDLDGLAVTRGPGLVGALLVGVQVAKALAYVTKLPLIGVNHLEGHLCSWQLFDAGKGTEETRNVEKERYVALLVSGGHTTLILVEAFGKYRMLGTTRDDAAGEAFDKVSKLLGIGYPGGPAIEKLAQNGDVAAIKFPRPLSGQDELDFSFSGLKTAVANYLRRNGCPKGRQLSDFCASFQQAVVDVLVRKTFCAVRLERVEMLVAAGGVIANGAIRTALAQRAAKESVSLHIPPVELCTDNAAMIARAGMLRLMAGERSGFDLSVEARLPL
ncbi:MAG: tRNA (adenosine(37)-N6)-threonylcarbamoyltransferase complex transferase subunit TsaD [Pseudomonadota bacterium]